MAERKKQSGFTKVLNDIRMLLVLIGLIILFSVLSPYFLQIKNIYAIGLTISVIGIVCIGQSLVLLTGAFDLSVGSIAGFSGMLVAFMTKHYGMYPLMLVLGLAVGALIGLINGLLITKAKVNALITTLSMMTIFQGATFLVSNGFAIGVNAEDFRFLGTTRVFEVPLPIIILIVLYVIFYFILRFTVFGRYIYSIGGNSEAAKLSGIKCGQDSDHGVHACGAFVRVRRHCARIQARQRSDDGRKRISTQLHRELRSGRHIHSRRRRQHFWSAHRSRHHGSLAVGSHHDQHAVLLSVDRQRSGADSRRVRGHEEEVVNHGDRKRPAPHRA